MKKIDINTSGNQSPGIVKGDFTINQTIINNYNLNLKKKWRKLDEVSFPAIKDDEDKRIKYLAQLVVHLHRAFKNDGYIEFSGFHQIRMHEFSNIKEHYKIDSDIAPTYWFISHQTKFIGELRKSGSYYWNREISLDKRKLYLEEIGEEIDYLFNTWAIDLQMGFSNKLIAWHFIYDPDARRIFIGSPPVHSTEIDNYPNNLETTTELLPFLSALNLSKFINFGDINGVFSNYPLLKLYCDILDNNGWNFENLRINANNQEEWDYINKSIDIKLISKMANT